MCSAELLEPSALYAAPDGRKAPLHVVIVAPPQVPGWVQVFCRLVKVNPWIRLTSLVVPTLQLPRVQDAAIDLRAFCLYERVIPGSSDKALAPVPLCPVDIPGCSGDADPSSLPERVGQLAPDLIIFIGQYDRIASLVGKARLGCWHVDATLLDPVQGGLSLIGPMVRGEDVTRVELVLQGTGGQPLSLASSCGRTRLRSFAMQREMAFRKLAPLLVRALRRVSCEDVVLPPRSVTTLALGAIPLGRAAGIRAWSSVAQASVRSLKGKMRSRKSWSLVVRQGKSALDPQAPTLGAYGIIRALRGWWADPCVIRDGERTLVFVEEMLDARLNKGTIACIELMDGIACRLGTALEEVGHLSFPQPFFWDGQWYMTVETGYARRTSLYRATRFPLEWVRERDLLTGWECVDPTLLHHGGLWYLFANVAECGNSTWDELFLFVSDRLDGEFRPHPLSPIVSDVRRARMAGRLFTHGGRLIRPAQDCAAGYGSAIVFHEVLELGPTTYRERTLSRLAPDWTRGLDACHTYNIAGGVEFLDIRGRHPRGIRLVHVSEDGADTRPSGAGRMTKGLIPAITSRFPEWRLRRRVASL